MRSLVRPAIFLILCAALMAGQSNHTRLNRKIRNLPLRFEPNVGQAGPAFQFLARGAGYALLLSPAEIVLRTGSVAGMQLIGADTAAAGDGENRQPALTHYLCDGNWHTDVPAFASVRFHDVYPGIDVSYSGTQDRLEYEFVIAPGADPAAIRLAVVDAESMLVAVEGDAVARLATGQLVREHPRLHQELAAGRAEVRGTHVTAGPGTVGFDVGTYDRSRPLMIAGTVVYSSFLGGSSEDAITSIALDSSGNIYVAGWTVSTDFTVLNAKQSSAGGSTDAFVAKLNPAGTKLLYATYLGGRYDDRAFGLAVDSSGYAIVAGRTASPAFPTASAARSTFGGTSDAFVAKLNTSGSGLIFSTYLGGRSADAANGVAVDASGYIYVTGDTSSSDFPMKNARQTTNNGQQDIFVTKLSGAGALLYSTYLGGIYDDHSAAIALDSSSNVYLTGGTTSTNFPVANAIQSANAGGQDAFVVKLDTTLTTLLYGTYLGGSIGTWSQEVGNAIAVDSSGCAYIAGTTGSPKFPLVNAIQSSQSGFLDAFVAKLSASGSALVYSTYLGGIAEDYATGIAVDSSGAAYVTGYTRSTGFPVASAIQTKAAGEYDAFVVILAATGTSMTFGSYLGGEGSDAAYAIAIGSSNNIYLVGMTLSYTFPTVSALQTVNVSGYGGFIACLTLGLPAVQIDYPSSGSTVSGVITIYGWAIDNTSSIGTAISSVQVKVDGTVVGTATYGVSRADVCAVYPGRSGCPYVGFTYQLDTSSLGAGSHVLSISASDSDWVSSVGTGSVTITVTTIPPTVWIDNPLASSVLTGTVTVSGWAIDNASTIGTAIKSVQVKVDGTLAGTATYGISRADVCAAHPGRSGCPYVGYSYSLNLAGLTAGTHTITVAATDSDTTPSTGSSSVVITVANGTPNVFIDSPAANAALSGTVTVRGWAINNTSAVGTAINTLLVKVDGVTVGTATYGVNRADVCAAYPGRPGCPYVGFTYALNTASLSTGTHVLTVAATDSDVSPDTGSASTTFQISGVPGVTIDYPASGSTVAGVITVSGWAIDNAISIGTAIGVVRVLVDGVLVGTASYGTSRIDVCAAYPGRTGCPYVGFTYQLNMAAYSSGTHTITVTATDTGTTPETGSTTITVVK